MHGVTPPPKQATLGRAARSFRFVHTFIAALDLVALSYVWACALADGETSCSACPSVHFL